jgi:hypothetical protein
MDLSASSRSAFGGHRVLRHHESRRELRIAAALVSPLDALSDALFSAHMVEHEILMVIAAPLFVLAKPAHR